MKYWAYITLEKQESGKSQCRTEKEKRKLTSCKYTEVLIIINESEIKKKLNFDFGYIIVIRDDTLL